MGWLLRVISDVLSVRQALPVLPKIPDVLLSRSKRRSGPQPGYPSGPGGAVKHATASNGRCDIILARHPPMEGPMAINIARWKFVAALQRHGDRAAALAAHPQWPAMPQLCLVLIQLDFRV